MAFTVTTRKASTANQKHHRRDKETMKKEQEKRDRENERRRREGKRLLRPQRIDPLLTPLNEAWIDEPVGKAYRRIFQKSVDEYNKKQTRNDRKISSYYKQILTSKTQSPAYEIVLMIGNKRNCPDDKTGKEMLREFVDGWKRRNPSMELIGAYYHADEATPHVHLDFVPVVENCKRGLSKQTGLIGAIRQQGERKGKDFWKRDEDGKIVRDKENRPVKMSRLDIEKEWTREQNDELEKIVLRHGFEVVHPERGKGREHLSIDDYGEVQDALRELREEKEATAEEREQLELTERQLDRFLALSAGKDPKTGEKRTFKYVYDKFINQEDERKANPKPYRPHESDDYNSH